MSLLQLQGPLLTSSSNRCIRCHWRSLGNRDVILRQRGFVLLEELDRLGLDRLHRCLWQDLTVRSNVRSTVLLHLKIIGGILSTFEDTTKNHDHTLVRLQSGTQGSYQVIVLVMIECIGPASTEKCNPVCDHLFLMSKDSTIQEGLVLARNMSQISFLHRILPDVQELCHLAQQIHLQTAIMAIVHGGNNDAMIIGRWVRSGQQGCIIWNLWNRTLEVEEICR